MKTILSLFVFVTAFNAIAQQPSAVIDTKSHKIVMQFSNGDSLQQLGVMTQLGNIREAWPNAKIEVVCHSSGLDILTSAKSKVSKQIANLSEQGVVFAACHNTMKRRNVNKEDLVPSSVVVPSAMLEIVGKQEAHWSYLKAGY
ncbi:MAG TPA: DsrE family protein [Cyclobacteriaceae bacterium]|nr:DsrE family protein [Cyclobacteriaceae bacterium]